LRPVPSTNHRAHRLATEAVVLVEEGSSCMKMPAHAFVAEAITLNAKAKNITVVIQASGHRPVSQ